MIAFLSALVIYDRRFALAFFSLLEHVYLMCSEKLVVVLWRIGTILGNGYGVQGQNYVALYQGSKM